MYNIHIFTTNSPSRHFNSCSRCLLFLVDENGCVGDRSISRARKCALREQAVEFGIVADGEHDVSRNNALSLVVGGGIARHFDQLGDQVFEDGRLATNSDDVQRKAYEKDGRGLADAFRVAGLAQQPLNATDREDEA